MIAKGDNKETPSKGTLIEAHLQTPHLKGHLGRSANHSETRPEAVWTMKEPILHILSKGRDEKPTNEAKRA
jgi:hypothetical protein